MPDVVGMAPEVATQAAAARGVEKIVVLQSVDGMTVTPRTMDWSPTRLNLVVERGIVVNAVFG